MGVRAKFRVSGITLREQSRWNPETQKSEPAGMQTQVEAHAVMGADNKRWAYATPGGTLSMTIDNPEAGKFFRPGQYLYLDLSEAPETDPEK